MSLSMILYFESFYCQFGSVARHWSCACSLRRSWSSLQAQSFTLALRVLPLECRSLPRQLELWTKFQTLLLAFSEVLLPAVKAHQKPQKLVNLTSPALPGIPSQYLTSRHFLMHHWLNSASYLSSRISTSLCPLGPTGSKAQVQRHWNVLNLKITTLKLH